MNTARTFFQSFLALAMSIGITAGSMYVTVSAAAVSYRESGQELEIESTTIQTSDEEEALRAVSVELNTDGSLTGRVSSIDSASGDLQPTEDTEVTLITRGGRELITTSDSDGTFTFGGLYPGAYTINAEGLEGRLSFGMRVIRSHDSTTDESIIPVPVGMELQLDAALAPSRDLQELNRLLSSISVDPAEAEGEFDESYAADDRGDDDPPSLDDAQDSPGQQLYLNNDGTFEGQLTLLDPGTGNLVSVRNLDVTFLESNGVVASASVNADGSFRVEDLEAGVYTMLIAGADGIAYMGVDVVDRGEYNDTAFQPVSGRRAQRLAMGMVKGAGAPPGNNSDGNDGDNGVGNNGVGNNGSPDPADPQQQPGGGTGGGSGGGSAGGGDGALGGLGLPLLLGAGGYGIYALTSDDDAARPASPVN